ncbi:MAG TPA: helix-turn-helix transcriptional regulator [Gemmatimonadales bacterium]
MILTAPEGAAPGPSVSPAELRVLAALVQGLSQKEMAHRLGLARTTVQFHLVRLRGRLGARTVPQLAAMAAAMGLVRPAPPAPVIPDGRSDLTGGVPGR